MITKEGFIEASEIEPKRAEKIYNLLEEKFDGNWSEASDYLKDLIKYLQKHK